MSEEVNVSPEISIVIPVFNSANCLEDLVREISSILNFSNKNFEIILVDDGSKDKSWEIIKKVKGYNKNVKGFLLGRNFGQHKATLCGIAHATGKWVVTMDDDFEHPPVLILHLIEKAEKAKADLLYGIPAKGKKSFTRNLISGFFKFASKMENADAGKGSSLRVISQNVAANLHNHHSHLFFLDEILLWYTDNIVTEKVDFGEHKKDLSGYNYPKLLSLSKNLYMISTTMPLKLMKFTGFTVSAFSFLMGLYYLFHKIFFATTKGYTSLILSILFSAGLILLCLGIIGEYLGNLLIMQNKKPGYSIREKI
ncbi:MAG: glycosyltransferase family 2 protein [Bacteroidia bacterium]|nr:glycosyltransferase family 2 protein [Bacteroidia bacterium]